jgi:DEAD/DEAH box helicase domain-containing protein
MVPRQLLFTIISQQGLGLSDSIYDMHDDLLKASLELIQSCGCKEGCPACVGPSSEKIPSGKLETIAILQYLTN